MKSPNVPADPEVLWRPFLTPVCVLMLRDLDGANAVGYVPPGRRSAVYLMSIDFEMMSSNRPGQDLTAIRKPNAAPNAESGQSGPRHAVQQGTYRRRIRRPRQYSKCRLKGVQRDRIEG
jgi:hypothetical protein